MMNCTAGGKNVFKKKQCEKYSGILEFSVPAIYAVMQFQTFFIFLELPLLYLSYEFIYTRTRTETSNLAAEIAMAHRFFLFICASNMGVP